MAVSNRIGTLVVGLLSGGLCLVVVGCSDSPPQLEVARLVPSQATSPQEGGDDRPIRLNVEQTPEQLIAQAKHFASMGNLYAAGAAAEEAIALAPDNREALSLMAAVCLDRVSGLDHAKATPHILQAAKLMKKLRDKHKDLTDGEKNLLGTSVYNEAIYFAEQGDKEKALQGLEDAVGAGFSGVQQLKDEKAFASLKKDPKFEKLVSDLSKSSLDAVKEKARALLVETQPASMDFRLPDLDGKLHSTTDYRGKVLIVDFWGTWCPPCKAEIPMFIELQKDLGEKGLQIIGVNFEQVEPEKVNETIATFVKENQVSYPCLVGDDALLKAAGPIDGFPTTFFIDRAGKVRAKVTGLLHPDNGVARAGMEEILNKLLSEEAPK